MESGKYYVRLVYSQEEVTTGIVDTANAFAYTNSSQPETITAIHAENAGDLQIRASLDTVTEVHCLRFMKSVQMAKKKNFQITMFLP